MKISLLSVLLMAGCTPLRGPDVTCNADNWDDLVGQPEAAIYGALGNLRVVRQGDSVPDDFNPNRLNAEIGPDGRVTRFACY